MADMAWKATRACRCLNVELYESSVAQAPPPFPTSEAEYHPVHVGDEGIRVAHTQLTLRSRSKRIPLIDQPQQCTRYITLQCLICRIIVYRVHQVVSLDVEGKEGPLLPTDDWVEKETLKSSSGWVEVHRDCLGDESLSRVEQSDSYSTVFNLLLPPALNLPAEPQVGHIDQTAASSSNTSELTPPSETSFPDLPPLFLPAPFTPSHPVFAYLSSIAIDKSQETRNAAQEHVTQVIRAKKAEVERFEDQLRREVELLWTTFRASVDEQSQQQQHNNINKRFPLKPWENEDEEQHGGTVSISSFVPTGDAKPRPPASHAPRVSSLSAALVYTRTVHPKLAEQVRRRSSIPTAFSPPAQPYAPDFDSPSLDAGPSSFFDSQSMSSYTGGGSVLNEAFRRSMDPAKDTIASFRYFGINDNMEKTRAPSDVMSEKQSEPSANANLSAATVDARGMLQGSNRATRVTSPRGNKDTSGLNGKVEAVGENAAASALAGGSKTKRKVTFDVEPDVVTIKREITAEKKAEDEAENTRDAEIMIFDLDEQENYQASPEAIRPSLTFVEPPRPPARRLRNRAGRSSSGHGLSESFSSLRPASLPLPSHIRQPPTTERHEHAAPQSQQTPARVSSPVRRQAKEDTAPEANKLRSPHDSREAELRKLVAADTPSHRGAWTANSRAWQLFSSRHGGRSNVPLIPEEEGDEGDDMPNGAYEKPARQMLDETLNDLSDGSHYSVASSLPIPMHLNPASSSGLFQDYSPFHDLGPYTSRDLAAGRAFASTDALRRAAYAKRDLMRSVDPGALDFHADIEEAEEEEEEEEDTAKEPLEAGQRGRERALKILQARSQLPEEGMWRSLA